jgi:hypothetical protein
MSEIRNSSLLGKITVAFVICYIGTVGLCLNTAVALDGSGTKQDPWRIQSLEDFNDFAADAIYWDDYTRLETDVNLAGLTYTTAVIAPDTNNSNLDFDGITFTGVFDGNDHKIINLNIDDGGAGNSYLGLFGQIYDGEVRNLGLEGGSVSGDSRVGCLVGFNCHGSLSNCYSTGSVSGGFGYGSVGGLVGWNNGGSISDCYSTGSVSGVSSGGCGGLVGWNNGGSISDCYSTGDVIGPGDVGGLVGTGSGTINNCYSTGDVSGNTYVGGLVGFNVCTIRYCYSTGSVSGEYYVGGLVGINLLSVSNCLWDIDKQTHGVTESIGGNQGTATNVASLPTAQMQKKSTFTDADWDFINVWNIGENQTYPYLRVYLAGDINKDGIVNFLDFAITANQWMEDAHID